MEKTIQLADGTSVEVAKHKEQEDGADSTSGRVHLEKVNNVWGSTAGAGSDFFHLYRKQRAVEMERIEKMDADWVEEEEDKKFREKRALLIKANQERTDKNAAKRRKKKEARDRRKSKKSGEETTNAPQIKGPTLPPKPKESRPESDHEYVPVDQAMTDDVTVTLGKRRRNS
eukprot:GHVN01021666.1.p2 GENE.GHVN01021666.1~~GHVN01021666.1.p2  ORF type:complete len:172 (+),score=33.15 GHVN01021666.1:95-610(+)